jgi:uncharacterized membrane protein
VIALALATLSAVAYGGSDFAGGVASKEHDSALVTVAVQIASLLTLGVLLVAFAADDAPVPSDFAWGALGGLGAAFGLVMFYRALAVGPMSVAAALTALVGATLPVAAGLLLGGAVGGLTIAGALIAIPAAVLVSVGAPELAASRAVVSPRQRLIQRSGRRQTQRMAVQAGCGFALFLIALSRVSDSAGLYPLVGARAASVAALVVLLTARRAWAPIQRGSRITVGIGGVLDCAANSLYLVALERGHLSWVAAIASLYPVTTVLLARVVLRERLAGTQVAGFALAGAALAVIAAGAA